MRIRIIWETWGGSSVVRDGPGTSMGLKGLIDGLNYMEFLQPDYQPSYYDRNIVAMHFYHNLVFIEKGENNDPVSPVKPAAANLTPNCGSAAPPVTPDQTPSPPNG